MQTLKYLKLGDVFMVHSTTDCKTHGVRQYVNSYSKVDAILGAVRVDGWKPDGHMVGVKRDAAFFAGLSAADKALNPDFDPKGECVQVLQGNCRTTVSRKLTTGEFLATFPNGVPYLVHDRLSDKEAFELIVDDRKDPTRKHLSRSEFYDVYIRMQDLGFTQAEIEVRLGESENTETALAKGAKDDGKQESRTRTQMFERLRQISNVEPEILVQTKLGWNVNDDRVKEKFYSFSYIDVAVLTDKVKALKEPLNVGGPKKAVNVSAVLIGESKTFTADKPLVIVNANINAMYFTAYKQDKADMGTSLTRENAVWLRSAWNAIKRDHALNIGQTAPKNARTKAVIAEAAGKMLVESSVKDALRWAIVETNSNIETLALNSAMERSFCNAYPAEYGNFVAAGGKRVYETPKTVSKK